MSEYKEEINKGIPAKVIDNIYHTKGDIDLSDRVRVHGYDFNNGIDYEAIWKSMKGVGAQSTNLAHAIDIINEMVTWRLSDDPIENEEEEDYKDPEVRANTRCMIFFGYTSNMMSMGSREYIGYLCEHRMIDCIVTTCGGVEEDFIKCMGDFHIGAFDLDGSMLGDNSINRIGNILAHNRNYENFEAFFLPIIKEMHEEQKTTGGIFSPSQIIEGMGSKINNKESVYYWCYKNKIPVFCPAITDGAIGDVLFFYNYNNPGFIVDILYDIAEINKLAMTAKKSGMIICGGGVIKHHINNANMMRNGADLAVYINTAQEFDCSDAGARPEEALSWGKIGQNAKYIKVYSEFTLVLPIIMAECFARNFEKAGGVKNEEAQ